MKAFLQQLFDYNFFVIKKQLSNAVVWTKFRTTALDFLVIYSMPIISGTIAYWEPLPNLVSGTNIS